MSSHTQAIDALRRPLTDAEAEALISKRIDAKWVEALREEERNRLRAIAGQPSEALKIAMQFRRDK